MSILDRADLIRAKNLVRVVKERGPVHEDDLVVILGCTRAESRMAVGIALQWRHIDRCGAYLIAAPSREGRRAA